MRLIDADALIEALNNAGAEYNRGIEKCIEDAPTIDAVEIGKQIRVKGLSLSAHRDEMGYLDWIMIEREDPAIAPWPDCSWM